jgi:tripartite ATP-independent transporter DctP family solute receptor
MSSKLVTVVAAALAMAAVAAPVHAQDKKVTLRIASAFDQNTDMMQAAKRFGDLVKERSGGSIEVKTFAGGQMGGEKDNLEALKLGELEMGVFGTYPIVTLTPKYSFFDAPFVFRDRDHVYKVWSGRLGNEVRDVFAKSHGVHSLGMMGRGYRHITSNTPINSVDDLKGVKIRMGQSKPFIEAFTGLGAVVVPIALPELFTSLKLGVVSASDGPFDQIYTFKLQEAQKYLAITGHLYATSLWLMNDEFYQGLSASQKQAVDSSEGIARIRRSARNDEREGAAGKTPAGRHAGDASRLRAVHGARQAGDRQALHRVVVGHDSAGNRERPLIDRFAPLPPRRGRVWRAERTWRRTPVAASRA